MGATAAHRAPKRVTDGMCTQVWAWMTNRCRRKMNRGEGHITTEISQRKGKGKKRKEEEKLLGDKRSWQLTSSDENPFSP